MKTGYLENRLAALFASWIETRDKNSELYNLVHVFLTLVLPREECPEAQDLPKDKDKAAACFSLYSEKLSPLLGSDVENPALGSLEKRFGLSQLDRRLLEFFYLYRSFAPLEGYFYTLHEWEVMDRLRAYCGACESDVVSALQVDGLLMRSGIGCNDVNALRMSRHGITFGLSSAILAFIETNGARPLSSFLLEQWKGEALPLSSFELPIATIAAARASLTATRGKAVLFLTGSPGTGKTEFSRSISCASGLVPYKIKRDSSSGKRSFSDLLLAARLVDPAGEVLVIDEADDILKLDPGLFASPREDLTKSMINDFLDSSAARMIFITNGTYRIPDSILRRFSFHIPFENFSPSQRLRVWNSLGSQENVFTENERRSLACQYRANPARIRQVLDVCGSIASNQDGADGISPMDIAREMLSRSDEILYHIPRANAERVTTYDPHFLNLDVSVDKLLTSMETWKTRSQELSHGLNLLFFGLPGTGKTAFARHLAESLSLSLSLKNASDLLSPWVGETEQKIREAFKESEGQMLIIDEADTFLTDRSRGTHSWERSMTNEILTAMETFKGVFVASTNFNSVLDPACLRRFTYKIEFRPTAPTLRFDLVSAYFPGMEWNDTERSALARLGNITPGDVAVAARRLELASEASPALVLSALREEITARDGRHSTPIGFK